MGLENKNFDGSLTCALRVSDLERSIEWYNRVLGFEFIYKTPHGWAEMRSPVSKVNIGLSQVQDIPKGGNAVLTWGIFNMEESKKQLEKHKTKLDGDILTIPEVVKLLTFFDPDDNCLMFFQDLKQTVNL